jgi:hypothetical protein
MHASQAVNYEISCLAVVPLVQLKLVDGAGGSIAEPLLCEVLLKHHIYGRFG